VSANFSVAIGIASDSVLKFYIPTSANACSKAASSFRRMNADVISTTRSKSQRSSSTPAATAGVLPSVLWILSKMAEKGEIEGVPGAQFGAMALCANSVVTQLARIRTNVTTDMIAPRPTRNAIAAANRLSGFSPTIADWEGRPDCEL
jgi:hypothetical protein